MTDEKVSTSPVSRGIPLNRDVPLTLADLFLLSAKRFDLPDALNFRADGKWNSISAVTMVERSENIALGLYSLDLSLQRVIFGQHSSKVSLLRKIYPVWVSH